MVAIVTPNRIEQVDADSGRRDIPAGPMTACPPRVREHNMQDQPVATAPVGDLDRSTPPKSIWASSPGNVASRRIGISRLVVNPLTYPLILQYFLSTPSSTRFWKNRTAHSPSPTFPVISPRTGSH